MTRSPRRATFAMLALVVPVSGCWWLAEVEQREVAVGPGEELSDLGCPSLFVRSVPPGCATCLVEESCCAALRECGDSERCRGCVGGDDWDDGCATDPELVALRRCVEGPCLDACDPPEYRINGVPLPECDAEPTTSRCFERGDHFGRVQCDVIASSDCDTAAGEVCALDLGIRAWQCRGTGHHRPVCEECGLIDGECEAGHLCVDGLCYQLCCHDDDCPGRRCFYLPPHAVSVCVAESGTTPPP